MDIGSVTLSNAGLGRSAQAGSTLLGSFDTFLILLTTQLQNQDPLSPMDTNQITNQLVQFSGVEQSIATNKNLETLIKLSVNNSLINAVAFLGNNVVAQGDTSALKDGGATWTYNFGSATESTSVIISEEGGRVVFVGDGETGAGRHDFVWDGRDTSGQSVPDGIYKINVSGTTITGETITASTEISGIVTGISSVDGEPVLAVNGTVVPINRVISVSEPT